MVCLEARDSLLSLTAYAPFASAVFRRGCGQWIISYRSRACRNAMEYSDLAPVAPERHVILDKRDAEARCRAKKAGISFLSRAFSS